PAVHYLILAPMGATLVVALRGHRARAATRAAPTTLILLSEIRKLGSFRANWLRSAKCRGNPCGCPGRPRGPPLPDWLHSCATLARRSNSAPVPPRCRVHARRVWRREDGARQLFEAATGFETQW